MKRRYISILLAGLLAVSPVYQSVYAAEESMQEEQVVEGTKITDSEYSYYIVNDNQVAIQGYNGSDTDVVIPEEIDGMQVVYIVGAFNGNTNLRSVTIPGGMSGIVAGGFSGCTNLQKVTFLGSVTSLNPGAFSGCEKLEEIELPTGLKIINMDVFYGCKNLKKIFIPESVEHINPYGLFSGCDSLAQIIVDSNNATYCDIDGVLFSKDKTKLWKYPKGKMTTNYTIPDSVTDIEASAFIDCEKIESIYIPDTVEEIGGSAFVRCKSLKYVRLSANEQNNWYTFENCSKLEYVDIPEGAKGFRQGDFEGCVSLKTLAVPKTFEYFSAYSFNGCTQLESILCLSGETQVVDHAEYGYIFNENFVIYAPLGGRTEETAKAAGIPIRDASEYLSAPILSDISTTDSTITLTWEPVNRARGYYIYRKSDGSEWEQVGAVNEPDITSYTDETAVAGTSYTYTACAYTAMGSFLGPRDETGKNVRIPAALKLEAQTGGINVTTTDEILTPDTRLVADRVSTSVKDLINDDFVGIADYDWRSVVVYDIYLEKDGQKVQPNGEVTVSIPVPDIMNGEQCSVLYIDDAGNVIDMHAVYENGYMVFATNHFSHYALVEAATGVEVSGTITSYGTEEDVVIVSLLDGDIEVESVENTDSTYTFATVPFGTYTLQVCKENHMTRTYDITVSDEPVTQDVKICLIGDVTGDGKVNTRDLNRLYAHVNGTNPLTGYEFDCGDVTGDGKLNTRDLNRLYAHISETNPLW